MKSRCGGGSRLVVLDRDGVINLDREDGVRSLEDWLPIRGSLEAMARLYRAGFTITVATNQSAVARGLLSLDTLGRIHARMRGEVGRLGGRIAGVYVCPHAPDAGCECRKPAPGLLHRIARELDVELAGAYLVGDSERDLVSARQVMACPVLVRTGNGRKTIASRVEIEGVRVFDDLAAFAEALLA
jgi:D-glycero-D-manno-heptose 1,7-bisphosphate phosphatase